MKGTAPIISGMLVTWSLDEAQLILRGEFAQHYIWPPSNQGNADIMILTRRTVLQSRAVITGGGWHRRVTAESKSVWLPFGSCRITSHGNKAGAPMLVQL